MNKKIGWIIGIIVVVFILFINKGDNNVNWVQTYNEEGTNPFDTKVFHEQLDFWFKDQANKNLYNTFYEYQSDLDFDAYAKKKNYISVSDNYTIDKTSFNQLLDYISDGKQAFIASNYFPDYLLDTLGIKIEYNKVHFKDQTYKLYLENVKDSLVYTSKRTYGASFFKDTIGIKKLGYLYNEVGLQRTNFIGVPYKEGVFYLHSSPEVLTNYQLLNSTSAKYVSAVMSYLPKEIPFLYDKNVKTDPELSNSPLRFIISKPPLKWSWYLLLLTIGLFLIFNAKRRQRVIPIIEPLKNTTTEFVKSISTIHYEASDYNGIIQKNIKYFLEHIRKRYYLSTDKLDEDFIKKLALKSGKSFNDIQQLITLVIKMKAHKFSTEEPLKKLNKQLENFYKK